jgi:hypothetical protein
MAPVRRPVNFFSRRRSKNSSYPSMVFNCVLVRGLPCKFKSINGVSARSSFGNGCGFLGDHTVEWTDILFCLKDSVFKFDNFPIDDGKLTMQFESKLKSFNATKFDISSGTLARLLCDKSNFSNETKVLETIGLGILDKELFDSNITLNPFGNPSGKGGAFGDSGFTGRPN